MLPIECVVRGYLSGSGWKDYTRDRRGLRSPAPGRAGRVAAAARADLHAGDEGRDRPRREHRPRRRGRARRRGALRRGRGDRDRALPLRLRLRAASAGIILADTKLEFGLDQDGRLVLGDEAFTPDSSRFWPADGYAPGGTPPVVRQAIRHATTASRSAGTRPPPARSCRTTSSRAPAPATSRRSNS